MLKQPLGTDVLHEPGASSQTTLAAWLLLLFYFFSLPFFVTPSSISPPQRSSAARHLAGHAGTATDWECVKPRRSVHTAFYISYFILRRRSTKELKRIQSEGARFSLFKSNPSLRGPEGGSALQRASPRKSRGGEEVTVGTRFSAEAHACSRGVSLPSYCKAKSETRVRGILRPLPAAAAVIGDILHTIGCFASKDQKSCAKAPFLGHTR